MTKKITFTANTKIDKLCFLYNNHILVNSKEQSGNIQIFEKKKGITFKDVIKKINLHNFNIITGPFISSFGIINSLWKGISCKEEEKYLESQVNDITGYQNPVNDFYPLGAMKWAFESFEKETFEYLSIFKNIKIYSIFTIIASWVLEYVNKKNIDSCVFAVNGNNFWVLIEIKNSMLSSFNILPFKNGILLILKYSNEIVSKNLKNKTFFVTSPDILDDNKNIIFQDETKTFLVPESNVTGLNTLELICCKYLLKEIL
jgi:hypothetical protein